MILSNLTSMYLPTMCLNIPRIMGQPVSNNCRLPIYFVCSQVGVGVGCDRAGVVGLAGEPRPQDLSSAKENTDTHTVRLENGNQEIRKNQAFGKYELVILDYVYKFK